MCPEPIAPHLEHFITPWCTALRTVRDDVEKEHAFLGLAALLRMNALVCTFFVCLPLVCCMHRSYGLPMCVLMLASVAFYCRPGMLRLLKTQCPQMTAPMHTALILLLARSSKWIQCCVQGALSGFVPLCEAIASWHIIRCDGLRHELIQLMQLYRNNLAQVFPCSHTYQHSVILQ